MSLITTSIVATYNYLLTKYHILRCVDRIAFVSLSFKRPRKNEHWTHKLTRKPCYRRDNRAMPQYISIRMTIKFYNGIVASCKARPHVRIRLKFVNIHHILSFTRSWDNMGYPKACWQSLDTPTLPFLQNF